MSNLSTLDNRAVIYRRVSGRTQEDNESLAAQEKICREYAAQAGLVVVAADYDVMSGAKVERPGLSRLRELLRDRAASHLVIWKLDRLSRADEDDVEAVLMARELRSLGVAIHLAQRGKPIGENPEDDFFLSIEKAFARYERKQIMDRTAMGRRAKVERGAYLGNGIAPYGYVRVGEKKSVRLEIEPREAAVVHDIFAWYVVGDGEGPLGVAEIIKRLRSNGVSTPGEKLGHNDRRRGSGEWNPHTVYSILSHPIYKGKAPTFRFLKEGTRTIERPESERVYIDVPAVVSAELWQAAQDKRSQGRAMSPRNLKHQYLVGRRIKCKCGYKWQGAPTGNRGRVFLYYHCNSKDRTIAAGPNCGIPSVRTEKLDAIVWDWLFDLLQDEDRLRSDLERRQREGEQARAEINGAIADELAKVREIEERQDTLLDGFTRKIVKPDAYEKKNFQLEQQKAEHERTIEKLEQRAATALSSQAINSVFEYAAILRDKADAADFETKRFLVDILNVHVVMEQEECGCLWANVSCEINMDRLRVVLGKNCNFPCRSRRSRA